ncbi:MAG TPA: PilZ domain-containing protein [Myxococcota bacterium]|nr:PilZ domain-containing protein [Myxococcota bacterium]
MPELQASAHAQHLEKRRFARLPVWLRCWVTDDLVQRYACIEELSAGGARIVTAMPPQLGVSVRVLLPTEAANESPSQVWVPAQVIWRAAGFQGRGGVMGVRFVQPTSTDEILRFADILQG